MSGRRGLPVSGAYVLAGIALVAALGGGAYALEGRNSVNSGDIKNEAVKPKDLSDPAYGARASGVVQPDGTLVDGEGVAAITHPLNGRYCIEPASRIDPDTAALVVGAIFDHGSTPADAVVSPQWLRDRVHCPSGTLEVAAFLVDVGGGIGQADNSFAFVIP